MAFNSNLVLALVLLTVFGDGSMAQSGCTNVLIGMAPCLNYVTGSSKTPSSSCCSSLANVVKSQPRCLCTALDGSTMAALGITINKTTALALPGACHVKTPPISRCGGSKQVLSNGETSNAACGGKDMHHMIISSILVVVALLR
ncbi:hypothetical protein L1887_38941 [Cichorium endivia]|nr:hypothetical protein L1887_38941 [Cichorium endivia]